MESRLVTNSTSMPDLDGHLREQGLSMVEGTSMHLRGGAKIVQIRTDGVQERTDQPRCLIAAGEPLDGIPFADARTILPILP